MLGFSWLAGATGAASPEAIAALNRLATTQTHLGRPTAEAETPRETVALWGSWRDGELRISASGNRHAAFVGETWFHDHEGRAALDRGSDDQVHQAVLQLPGSFQAVISGPEGVYLLPDVTGLGRLWYARAGRGTVFATHAVVLHAALGKPVDEQWLAARLVAPSLRDAWESRGPFRGIHPVAPGDALLLCRDGSVRTAAAWSPPRADVPLPVAAEALRAALSAGVAHRVTGLQRASGDLSGGLDSTSLAFLARQAAGEATSLLTITREPASPANDDPQWSRHASSLLDVENVVLPCHPEALPYAGIDSALLLDEPDASSLLVGSMRQSGDAVRAWGSGVHLAGNGGDQVLGAPLTYLRQVARAHPLTALRHLRGQRALHGLSLRTLRNLLRPGSYADWLAAAAEAVGTGRKLPATWAAPPRPWLGLVRSETLDVARHVIRGAAATAAQAGEDIERHGALIRVRQCAATQRLYRDSASALGFRLGLPYLDRAVVEACLATRSFERMDPYRVKPLLAEAMAGIVPAALLGRTTMGVYDTELHLGWRQHRPALAALLEDPALADCGMVDADAFRTALAGRHDTARLIELNEILAVELWLRALAAFDATWRASASGVRHQADDAGGDKPANEVD